MNPFTRFITDTFGPVLKPIFNAINNEPFAHLSMNYAKASAIGLFLTGMIFVWLLNKDYVNLGSPKKDIWHDLRFWTILSMLPHVICYFYF